MVGIKPTILDGNSQPLQKKVARSNIADGDSSLGLEHHLSELLTKNHTNLSTLFIVPSNASMLY
ncbi:MAG: hypothetical protein K8R13_07915 [Methanococcoides sp.]|nr:hypothetical protein [Methanococcoides sp.]